jgi:hypothetical protein
MVKVTVYRNYRFLDKDPIIDAIKTVVRSNEKLNNNHAHRITGVTSGTFDSWFEGGTRRPQNATISQVAAALGYVRRDELKSDGQLVVGFVKANSKIDYESEITKQADWIIKQGTKKPRKKKAKKNGQG